MRPHSSSSIEFGITEYQDLNEKKTATARKSFKSQPIQLDKNSNQVGIGYTQRHYLAQNYSTC